MRRTVYCWQCMRNTVFEAGLVCWQCKANHNRSVERWLQGKSEPTSERTHEQHRSPLEAADWQFKSPSKPKHKGSE